MNDFHDEHPARPRVVGFDLDLTLVDTRARILHSTMAAFADLEVPMQESRMMDRIFSLSHPPPNPSTMSLQPSSCRAPVSRMAAAIAASTARVFGQKKEVTAKASPASKPMISPTAGK